MSSINGTGLDKVGEARWVNIKIDNVGIWFEFPHIKSNKQYN